MPDRALSRAVVRFASLLRRQPLPITPRQVIDAVQSLDHLDLTVRGRSGLATLESDVALDVRDLRPQAVAGLLARLGLRPDHDAASVTARLTARVGLAPRSPEDAAAVGQVAVRDLRVEADGREVAAIDQLDVGVDSWTSHGPRFGKVAGKGVRGALAIDAQGVLCLCGLGMNGSAAPPAAAHEAPAESPATGPLFSELSVEDVAIGWRDASVQPPVATASSQLLKPDSVPLPSIWVTT